VQVSYKIVILPNLFLYPQAGTKASHSG